MENIKVTLDIEHYNELKEFKDNLLNGNSKVIIRSHNGFNSYYITNSDAIQNITEINNKLYDELYKIKLSNSNIISDIKKMSFMEFLKIKYKK